MSAEPIAMERSLPQDHAAEQALLGACMLSAAALEQAYTLVVANDFYAPKHQTVWGAMLTIRRRGEPVDPVTVAAELTTGGQILRVGGAPYLHELTQACGLPASVGHYARIVRERAVRRRLITAGTRVTQLGWSTVGDDAYALAEAAVREVTEVRDAGLTDEDVPTLTINELLAAHEDVEYDWLVPGLLERGERLILTGAEGLGKSTLIRQMAVTMAAGLHPFSHQPIDPLTVLLIDVENSERGVARGFRPLVTQARLQGHPVAEHRLWVEAKEEGLDLTEDRDASWLMRRIDQIRPDVLFIGPLYKLHAKSPNEEEWARKLAGTLDMARTRHGTTLVIEAHAGNSDAGGHRRDLRPRGSSLWRGWPNFGRGIRLVDGEESTLRRLVEFESWRGDREERQWPERLEAGGTWPWVEASPNGFRRTY